MAEKQKNSLYSKLRSPEITESIKTLAKFVGYETLHWSRVVPYRECRAELEHRNIGDLEVLEISAGKFWRELNFRNFTEFNFPEFDICEDYLDKEFDVVIADNVLEHVERPVVAATNCFRMLKEGGVFVLITPFLIRYHPIPTDYHRWTASGLHVLLRDAGFPDDKIRTFSWGNISCVKANLKRWARRGWFGSLKNDPRYPVTVWGIAEK